ncbi:MAG: PqqD family protein [Bacteroidaceae bacterium]|nr:PqqD family protein [Bacteroidaceae bacterium]MBQ3958115.1 PqqD family protein [Bacteroidaceae bacterium]MBQ4003551.1 PqqD family protein [Bacteroidaceae bacterium]
MKIKKGFELRQICGENIIVAYGEANIDFSRIISLNESAAFLWKTVLDKEFTEQTLADALCAEYEVDAATALRDAKEIAARWKEVGLTE